jgi:regulatory protein
MPTAVAPPTPERLHARALRYLERYATTAAHLRRVLLRRAARDAEALGLETARVRVDVDAVIARLIAAGLVDDRQFALGRARRLADFGRSPARIRVALAAKGLTEPAIEAALRELAEERDDPELAAAIAYARRRRLGPWRPPESRVEHRAKDLAALGRAGFGYRAARLVVDADDPETLASAVPSQRA